MKVVVVDLELTCWAADERPPHNEESEIIEIGVTLFTPDTRHISQPRRIFVQPTNSTVSTYCVELTGITDDVLRLKGISRRAATDILINEYKLDKRIWCGWGDDATLLQKSLGYAFSRRYIDLSAVFTALYARPRNYSLSDALSYVGLNFEGTPHRGGDDAYNTARLLAAMSNKVRL
jgi:inhibitor of KinA sporulation pathway (predicted exonuclease)